MKKIFYYLKKKKIKAEITVSLINEWEKNKKKYNVTLTNYLCYNFFMWKKLMIEFFIILFIFIIYYFFNSDKIIYVEYKGDVDINKNYKYFNKDKVIYVKYKGNVMINENYEYFSKYSSFIGDNYYYKNKKYLIMELSDTYYNYCDFPNYLWLEYKKTKSLGRFYNKNIKGKYGCK